ncbi:MAG: hypothetical protein J7K33_03465 [Candidatus Marinimicrobia bacterium]|nr:hypothetical protein [Candidatus Neomarinimicrobiota bacterium]
MKVFKVHVYLEGDVDTLEDAEETYATFIVMAKDERQAEILVKEYIKKENPPKGDVEILNVEGVPIDQAQVLGMGID